MPALPLDARTHPVGAARCAAISSLIASAVSVVSTAHAQGLDELEGMLDEAVVEGASKASSNAASLAPATTTSITAEDLRRYGVHSLDEALNFLSLGMLTENPRETVEIGARGVLLTRDYGNHVLLLVDGHVMNEPWGGTAYFDRGAAIPFELIDHIEVILGPGSVLYGSNAMLGVINVVTKRAKDFRGLRAVVESELPISIRGAAGFGREFSLFKQRGEVTIALDYYASRGPAATFGPQLYGADAATGMPKRFSSAGPATGIWTSEGNPNLFFNQVPAAYARLAIGGLEITLRGAMFKRWGAFVGDTDLAATDGYELDRWLSFDARYRATLSRVVKLSARVYGDLYDYREYAPTAAAENCLEGQTRGCVYDLLGRAKWLGSEITTTLDWQKDGSVVTLVGVDGRLRRTDGSSGDYIDAVTRKAVSSGPSYGAVEKAAAVFVEQTATPAKSVDLNAGARIDVDERFGFHVSPRAALVVTPWRGGHFKAVFAEAFRAPTAYERYFNDPKFQIAASGLEAETVRSLEGSFEQRLGGHRLLATVFRTWWKDLVVDEPLSDAEIAAAQRSRQLAPAVTYAYQYRNVASVDNFGASLLYEGILLSRRLRYGLGVTGAYAREQDGDNQPEHALPAAARLFGNARVSYDIGGAFPVVALAGRFTSARPIAGTGFTPTPSAGPIVELRATISGPFPKLRGLTYRVSANALLAAGSPYSIGPLSAPAPGYTRQETTPLDRFRVTTGLEYALPL